MATKVRKQVYIEPYQEVALKRLGQMTGVSEAEIIRQAIDNQIRLSHPSHPDLEAWEKERRFIRDLMARGVARGRRTWRREDLHER